MIRHITLFFIVFISVTSASSLAQEDTLQGKDYKELTNILRTYVVTDSAMALRLSEYYIRKAQKEQKPVHEAEGIHALSLIYYQYKDGVNSAREMDRLLTFVKLNELDDFRLRAYQLAGAVYLTSGQIQKSINANKELIKIAEETGDTELQNQAEIMLDFIDSMGGENQAFISKYKAELDQLITNPPPDISNEALDLKKMRIEALIGDAFIKMESGDSSAYYIKSALKKSLRHNDTCATKSFYSMLGAAEILSKDYKAAKKNLDLAITYCTPLTKLDSLLIGGSRSKIAYHQGNYRKAIGEMESALKAYEVTDADEAYMQDSYMILADSYKELGNLEMANSYFQKHINTTNQFDAVQDSIQRNIRQKELDSFKTELHQLEAEKEKKQRYLNYLFLGASVIILVLLFLLLKFYRNKRQNEAKFEALLAKIESAKSPEEIIDTKDEDLEEKETTDVPEETKQQILTGLKKLEEKEYFLQQDCTSYNVAKKIGTNTSYLSKVINAHFGKNFNTYINDLRINYAIVRIKNDVLFRSYSIQSIAEEIGYKSADSFTKYFKKDTGLNPSFYIKNIKNIA